MSYPILRSGPFANFYSPGSKFMLYDPQDVTVSPTEETPVLAPVTEHSNSVPPPVSKEDDIVSRLSLRASGHRPCYICGKPTQYELNYTEGPVMELKVSAIPMHPECAQDHFLDDTQ